MVQYDHSTVVWYRVPLLLAAKFRPAPLVAILKSNPVDAWAGVGSIKNVNFGEFPARFWWSSGIFAVPHVAAPGSNTARACYL